VSVALGAETPEKAVTATVLNSQVSATYTVKVVAWSAPPVFCVARIRTP
jgi:hypothetical protein